MSNSRFEYVRNFETQEYCLKETYILIRVDGKGFHQFSQENNFQKPNDIRALQVMNSAALDVCEFFNDIFIAYGQSDEFSFAFQKSTNLYKRRRDKLGSLVVSLFSSSYLRHFYEKFGSWPINLPIFDSRVVLYPSEKLLKDYFRWRQVDCHINNLYNTCFWSLVKLRGKSNTEAEQILSKTLSKEKQEMLFSELGINYNNELDIFKKGTVIIRSKQISEEKTNRLAQRE